MAKKAQAHAAGHGPKGEAHAAGHAKKGKVSTRPSPTIDWTKLDATMASIQALKEEETAEKYHEALVLAVDLVKILVEGQQPESK